MPYRCIVPGCDNYRKRWEGVSVSYHRLPTDADRCREWLRVIKNPRYDESAPPSAVANLRVSSLHFVADDYSRHMRSEMMGGTAKRLLKTSAVPTICGGSAGHGEAEPRERRGHTAQCKKLSASMQFSASCDVACQTDPPEIRSVSTQLSLRTLQPHFRSAGVQATVSCKDFGVGTADPWYFSSTSVRRPSKRSRPDLEEANLQDTSAGTYRSPGQVVGTGIQVTVPETNSAATEKLEVQHVVDEEAILQLMQNCPMCNRKCRCIKRICGPYLIVYQSCYFCHYQRKWANQPNAPNISSYKTPTPAKRRPQPKVQTPLLNQPQPEEELRGNTTTCD